MSNAGTNMEDDPTPIEVDPNEPPPTHEDEDPVVTTVKGADGSDVVPLATMLRERERAAARAEKKAEAKIRAEYEAKYSALTGQIEEIRPYANALRDNPDLITQIKNGTHATSRAAVQPEDDTEARDTAEDFGFYTADGKLDIARGRRVLDRSIAGAERKLGVPIAQIRQQTALQASQAMRGRVSTMRDAAGTPVASEESLNEIWGMMGDAHELTANPQVAFVMALAAAGMDRFKGRRTQARTSSPPEYLEPTFTEPGGRRGAAGPSQDLIALGEKVGLTTQDLSVTRQRNRAGGVALE